MIVTISQTSFVIPLSALARRIGLVITQFLALTNIFINEQVTVANVVARIESEISHTFYEQLLFTLILFYETSRRAPQEQNLLQSGLTY